MPRLLPVALRPAVLALAVSGLITAVVAGPAAARPIPATAAAVRPATGWYGGTVAGVTIGFRVGAGAKVRALRTASISTTCGDGIPRRLRVPALSSGWSSAARRGRLSSRFRFSDPSVAGLTASGSISATFTNVRRARGSIRVRFSYPTGTTCDTGMRRFTVTRRRTEPIAPAPLRIFAGRTADGSLLEIAMTAAGDTLRPVRMRAPMQCNDGTAATLDVVNPVGADLPAAATFSGSFRYVPPTVPGHPAPSGGAVQVSGRVTATGVEGAARLSLGFSDGSWCDGGWTLFTFAGDTSTAVG